MKTCSRCNFENDEAADYCVDCGANIKSKPATPHGAPSPPPMDPALRSAGMENMPPPPGSLLCTSCLYPNPDGTPFCERCGAPIGAISAVGPIEHLYAEGFAYRQATEGRPKTIVFIGMWILFFPPLVLLIPILSSVLTSRAGLAAAFPLLGFLLLGGICAVILVKVTVNYFKKPHPASEPDDPAVTPAEPAPANPANDPTA